MNLKRFFGAILTILGIAGIIYGAWMIVAAGGQGNWVVAGVSLGVGLIFFFAGIGLVKRTKDES